MPIQNISIQDYQSQFTAAADYVLVDVREADEYAEGHLPGAIHTPLSMIQQRVNEIRRDKPIVLVCARGGRSMMAAEFMENLGYTDLYNLVEGTVGWMMSGLPLEKE